MTCQEFGHAGKKRAHQIAGSVHGIRRLIMGMKQGQI